MLKFKDNWFINRWGIFVYLWIYYYEILSYLLEVFNFNNLFFLIF